MYTCDCGSTDNLVASGDILNLVHTCQGCLYLKAQDDVLGTGHATYLIV